MGYEEIVVGAECLSGVREQIREHISELLPMHTGHRVRIYDDSPHLVWVECVDCSQLWDHCDFCNQSWLAKEGRESQGAKRVLDFGCRKCPAKNPFTALYQSGSLIEWKL